MIEIHWPDDTSVDQIPDIWLRSGGPVGLMRHTVVDRETRDRAKVACEIVRGPGTVTLIYRDGLTEKGWDRGQSLIRLPAQDGANVVWSWPSGRPDVIGKIIRGSNRKANLDWTLDEHILALDFYIRHRDKMPGKASKEVAELSQTLRDLAGVNSVIAPGTFRNPAGAYMKLQNLAAHDPARKKLGKVGLPHGNELERTVWVIYEHDQAGLARDAEAIRASVARLEEITDKPADLDHDEAVSEGAVVLRLHKTFERDSSIIRKKRLEATSLDCEVCGFDFFKAYGELGRDFIEVHHRNPVSLMQQKGHEKTMLKDLALVCANCHRMLHRRKLALTCDELRVQLRT